MAGLRRWMNRALSAHIPEKRVFVQSADATSYIRITPLSQLMLGTATLVAAGWMAVATAGMVLDVVSADKTASQTVKLQGAYQSRLDEISQERDLRARETRSAQDRFQIAMKQISRQQSAILESVEDRRELSAALDVMRERLSDAVTQRDAMSQANDQLLAQVSEVSETLDQKGRTGNDLDETLQTVSATLSDAVAARDAAQAEGVELARKLADSELKSTFNSMRQDEMIDELELAVAMSFGPLERLLKKSDMGVDSLIASVRGSYSGQGGPADGPVVSTRSFDDPAIATKFDRLMVDLDRMNLMRIAATKLPYAIPVKDSFRFTSGFGTRRDPKGWGRRMHSGVDFAAPRGTPIYSTAGGVVISAKREGGYGNTIRIQHEFGFESVYAHQTKLLVKAGQRISLGDHIGTMGSTGRSTGVHLHYEVHLNGRKVNPMTYMEAAKNVF
jgi:murein DD-endopeptidase MepM/ murein hydrolase activator NlpD